MTTAVKTMRLAYSEISPDTTCKYVATGKTARDVADKMMEHAKEDHAEDLEMMDMSEDEVMDMMESKAHS